MKKILLTPIMALLLFYTTVNAQKKPDYYLKLVMWENVQNWETSLSYEKNTYEDEIIKRIILSCPTDDVNYKSFDVYRKDANGATVLYSKEYFIYISNIKDIDLRKNRDKVLIFSHNRKTDEWKRCKVDNSIVFHWSKI